MAYRRDASWAREIAEHANAVSIEGPYRRVLEEIEDNASRGLFMVSCWVDESVAEKISQKLKGLGYDVLYYKSRYHVEKDICQLDIQW